jgi:hypothetical protein
VVSRRECLTAPTDGICQTTRSTSASSRHDGRVTEPLDLIALGARLLDLVQTSSKTTTYKAATLLAMINVTGGPWSSGIRVRSRCAESSLDVA